MVLNMAALCSWLRGAYENQDHLIREVPQVLAGLALCLLGLLMIGNSSDSLAVGVALEDASWSEWTFPGNLGDIPAAIVGFTRHSVPHIRWIDRNLAMPVLFAVYIGVFICCRVSLRCALEIADT